MKSPFSGKLQRRSEVVTCYRRTGNYQRGTAIEPKLCEPLWFTFPFEILSPFAARYVFTAYCVYPVLAKRWLTVEDLSSRFPLRPVSIFIWLFTRVFFFRVKAYSRTISSDAPVSLHQVSLLQDFNANRFKLMY